MLREVVSDVYQLEVRRSSVFFLLDERVTLIDAGTPWSAGSILRGLAELGRSPADLAHVLITHAHYDHWGSLAALLRHAPVEVCAHRLEAVQISGEVGAAVASRRGRAARVLGGLIGRLVATPVRVDRTFEGGEVLSVLGGLHVVHTPGHSAGHVAYYLPALRVLFSGDAVQVSRKGRLIPPTVYRDRRKALRSLGRMAELDIDVLAPTHFPPQRDNVRGQLQRLASRR